MAVLKQKFFCFLIYRLSDRFYSSYCLTYSLSFYSSNSSRDPVLRIWKFIACLWMFYSHKFQKFHKKVILTQGPLNFFISVHFSSAAQSCPTLCDPMDCSTPGLPVHHQLLELTQTHVHWVGDAIQPSHPLSWPSAPTFNHSQHQGLFRWVSSSHQVAKVLEFQL